MPPIGPPSAYQTFAITQRTDRSVVAACHEVGCQNWARGWKTVLDPTDPAHAQLATWIRRDSGRTFREQRDGALVVFVFEPKQRCFQEHRTMPQIFAVRPGDPRRYVGPVRRHVRAEDWVENFGENQASLAAEQQRG